MSWYTTITWLEGEHRDLSRNCGHFPPYLLNIPVIKSSTKWRWTLNRRRLKKDWSGKQIKINNVHCRFYYTASSTRTLLIKHVTPSPAITSNVVSRLWPDIVFPTHKTSENVGEWNKTSYDSFHSPCLQLPAINQLGVGNSWKDRGSGEGGREQLRRWGTSYYINHWPWPIHCIEGYK